MPIDRFPPYDQATPEGILAVGGDLHPDSLYLAYRKGIFPWPMDGLPLTWFCPPRRAILEFNALHLPRSLVQARKRSRFEFSVDRDFESVIQACSQVPRAGQSGTWITPAMLRAYLRLHQLGHAHSVEAWEKGELIGGIYGVSVLGTFAGESMFHLRPNASKLALLHLIEHLRARGLTWMDIQVMTPHMKALGAKEISRNSFLKKLNETQKLGLRLF